jgi:hypothetical protein
VHVYTALHGVVSLGAVALASGAAPVALWTAFDAAASLRIGPQPPTALVVGPRASVLLSASGSALALVGTPAALALLTGTP